MRMHHLSDRDLPLTVLYSHDECVYMLLLESQDNQTQSRSAVDNKFKLGIDLRAWSRIHNHLDLTTFATRPNCNSDTDQADITTRVLNGDWKRC